MYIIYSIYYIYIILYNIHIWLMVSTYQNISIWWTDPMNALQLHCCQATLKEPRPSARRSILRAREIPLRGSSSMKLRAGVWLDRWLVQTNSMGLPMGLARSGLGQGLPLLEKRCKLILSGSILYYSIISEVNPSWKANWSGFFKQS